MKTDYTSTLQQLTGIKTFLSEAEARVTYAENAKAAVEQQRSDIIKQKGNGYMYSYLLMFYYVVMFIL